MSPTPQEGIAAAIEAFGDHPGARALHAKGTLLKGTFTATPAAARMTRAGHMQGDPVPVTVRVSNGSGHPRSPDYRPDVRGLAVKFYLPGGSRTDIVAQTAPRFPFSEPGPFLELLRLTGKLAAAWKLPLLLARHPSALAVLPPSASAMRPPVSYATLRYYAVHAYRWLDAEGGSRFVRYTILPTERVAYLAPWKARGRGRDYLQDDIRRRVSEGTVSFTLELEVAGPDDDVDNPNAAWHADRQRVRAGTIELTGLDTERETGGDILVFDPTRVLDGIELSNDPVLIYRRDVYSESIAKRTGGVRP